jgi:alanine racemase
MTELSSPSPSLSSQPNAWIEVDFDVLQNNASSFLSYLKARKSHPQLIAVIKADGYGHGALNAYRAFSAAGVDRFAVTSIDEALRLEAGGFDFANDKLLVFAPVATISQASEAVRLGVESTVCDCEHIHLLQTASQDIGKSARVHLKIDTGMGRLGVLPRDAASIAQLIEKIPELSRVGIYTHFSQSSEKSLAPTFRQLALFNDACAAIRGAGQDLGICHAANSAAALRLPQASFDAVRIGTALYGQAPSRFVTLPDGVSARTWQAKARVIAVRELPPGSAVGYGAETVLKRPSSLAILAIGFADGFAMSPVSVFKGKRGVESLIRQALGREKLSVSINGHEAPVVGRVAMQMTAADVTDIAGGVKIGDIATVPMRRLAASALLERRGRSTSDFS